MDSKEAHPKNLPHLQGKILDEQVRLQVSQWEWNTDKETEREMAIAKKIEL